MTLIGEQHKNLAKSLQSCFFFTFNTPCLFGCHVAPFHPRDPKICMEVVLGPLHKNTKAKYKSFRKKVLFKNTIQKGVTY